MTTLKFGELSTTHSHVLKYLIISNTNKMISGKFLSAKVFSRQFGIVAAQKN